MICHNLALPKALTGLLQSGDYYIPSYEALQHVIPFVPSFHVGFLDSLELIKLSSAKLHFHLLPLNSHDRIDSEKFCEIFQIGIDHPKCHELPWLNGRLALTIAISFEFQICLDYRDHSSSPRVVANEDTNWRLIANDYDSFIAALKAAEPTEPTPTGSFYTSPGSGWRRND